ALAAGLAVALLALTAASPGRAAAAPEAAPAAAGVRWDRVAWLGGGGLAAHYVGFRYFDRAWYQGQKRDSIRWLHDWSGDTYLNLDKGGHFMGGLFLASSVTDAYAWAGLGPRAAALLGTLTSWGVLLEIEMRDAYYDQWGFSIPDFAANTAGAAIPLARALFPACRAVSFKFSYWPSALYLDHAARQRAGRPSTRYAIDDYEGMTFWMTFGVGQLLATRGPNPWPPGLGLALGYGATGMHGSNVKSRGPEREYPELPSARPEVYLALDYDVRRLPGRSGWWEWLKEELNWLHLPAPAVRLYPDLRFYLLYL
ncbi:MAG: DUF2279 domain-containing protein, partial [Gemmatimonadota bacterium]